MHYIGPSCREICRIQGMPFSWLNIYTVTVHSWSIEPIREEPLEHVSGSSPLAVR